jgi:hypothetical protein
MEARWLRGGNPMFSSDGRRSFGRIVPRAALALLTLSTAGYAAGPGFGGPHPGPGQGQVPGGGNPHEPTPLEHVVMYAVDEDTHELMRYRFGSEDGAYVIGELQYDDGSVATYVECLGYIPSGSRKGLYGVHNYDGNDRSRLVNINVLDATVTPAPVDIGFGKVEGMVTTWDAALNKWVFYATHSGDAGAEPVSGGGLQINWRVDEEPVRSIEPDGTYVDPLDWWSYADSDADAGVTLDYNVNVRTSGLISGNIAVENTANEPVEVEIEMGFPIEESLWSETQLIGSVAIGVTTDGGGGTLGLVDDAPLWQGLLDGVSAAVAALCADPFEIVIDGLGSASATESFGMPSAVIGPPVVQAMGIRITFTLTPHDQMSLTSGFSVAGDPGQPASNQNLIRIDPETGAGQLVMPLGRRIEGLALRPGGTFYGSTDNELWIIDPATSAVQMVGQHAYPDVDGLEFAVGDDSRRIEVPGVPPGWTVSGALFGFSDAANSLVIMNPDNGEGVAYECALDASDLEGIVFLIRDPFGDILAVVGD